MIPEQPDVQRIMSMVEPILPRVGRKEIDQPKIALVQDMFPDKRVVKINACKGLKGTDRAIGPPSKGSNPGEAPFCRAIMKSRADIKVFTEHSLEQYDQLSN